MTHPLLTLAPNEYRRGVCSRCRAGVYRVVRSDGSTSPWIHATMVLPQHSIPAVFLRPQR